MRLASRGYNLVEILVASGLSMMVLGVTSMLIWNYFSLKRNLDVWSMGQNDMSFALKNIESDARSIVRRRARGNPARRFGRPLLRRRRFRSAKARKLASTTPNPRSCAAALDSNT